MNYFPRFSLFRNRAALFGLGLIALFSVIASPAFATDYTVNLATDTSISGISTGPNTGDLRYCFNQAKRFGGLNTIYFAPSLNKQTITLTKGDLISDGFGGGITINGPGANLITIVGGTVSQGVFVTTRGQITLAGLKITGSSASAVYNNGGPGTSTVRECELTGNSGSAIDNERGTLNVFSSTISGNVKTSGHGGGILNASSASTVNIFNSTVSGNSTPSSSGGGIYNIATLNVVNCTIVGNNVGGIASVGGTAKIANSIIAGNFQPPAEFQQENDVSGRFTSQGYKFIGYDTADTVFTGPGDRVGPTAEFGKPLDPRLGPLQNNGGQVRTMALLADSAAIDAGSDALAVDASANALTTDARG